MKLVYIAHPIGGDVAANVADVLRIVKDMNLTRPDLQPFAPYIVDVQALDDNIPEQRERGMHNNLQYFFKYSIIDVLYLCGSRISKGMKQELSWAQSLGIRIVNGIEGEVV